MRSHAGARTLCAAVDKRDDGVWQHLATLGVLREVVLVVRGGGREREREERERDRQTERDRGKERERAREIELKTGVNI